MRSHLVPVEVVALAGLVLAYLTWRAMQQQAAYTGPDYVDPQPVGDWPNGMPGDPMTQEILDAADVVDPQPDTGPPPVDTSANVGSSIMQALSSPVRGIRNNNPGNIRKGSTAWQGLAPEQSDSAFLQFDDMEHGIRAIAVTIKTYSQKYGLNSIAGIINRWAPPNENATGAYVQHVADALGVAPDAFIQVSDPGVMEQLVRAIIKQENGPASLLVSDSTIAAGVGMA